MRKTTLILWTFATIVALFMACDNGESYADQKKKERAAINSYISENNVTVISESQFAAQDYTTDTAKNEFVLFESSGVYMQIIDKGCGEMIEDGETTTVLCRFDEYNLLGDSLQLSNNIPTFSLYPEKMMVTNTSGTFSGSFDTSSSIIYIYYSSSSTTAVPNGWLVPFGYIYVGRPSTEDEKIAKLRLIVPHSQGHTYATAGVYPCLYDITYQRGR